jgi:exportin-2 (importin alpha re-exporter)
VRARLHQSRATGNKLCFLKLREQFATVQSVLAVSETISKGMNDIISTNHLEGVLGVFQKLLSLKSTESYAFKLLNIIIKHAPLNTLNPYLPTIFGLLLTRLQEHMKDTKTPKYCKLFISPQFLIKNKI